MSDKEGHFKTYTWNILMSNKREGVIINRKVVKKEKSENVINIGSLKNWEILINRVAGKALKTITKPQRNNSKIKCLLMSLSKMLQQN